MMRNPPPSSEFVSATRGSVPGGYTQLINRIFEYGYWAELSDSERVVYPAIAYLVRYGDDFRGEFSLSELEALTRLCRTAVRQAVQSLRKRGLIAVIPGIGRKKSIASLLVPVKHVRELRVSSRRHSECRPDDTQRGAQTTLRGRPDDTQRGVQTTLLLLIRKKH